MEATITELGQQLRNDLWILAGRYRDACSAVQRACKEGDSEADLDTRLEAGRQIDAIACKLFSLHTEADEKCDVFTDFARDKPEYKLPL